MQEDHRGLGAAVGGADADGRDRDAVGGRGAFTVGDARCRTEVHQLRNGDGRPWKLCRETFVGFSPDGKAVLATDADGDTLDVHKTPTMVASTGRSGRRTDCARTGGRATTPFCTPPAAARGR